MTDATIQKSNGIREMAVSLFDNDNRQHAEHAVFLLGKGVLWLFLWRFFSNNPIPEGGPLLSFMVDISVRIIFPILAAFFAVVGVIQLGWYAHLCWNAKSPSCTGGES